MFELYILANDADQRLDRFLQKALPQLPLGLMQKYIRTKRIKVCGKRTAQNYRLAEGDSIQLYLPEEFSHIPAKSPPMFSKSLADALIVCYEDEQILIAHKPPGLLSHSANGEKDDTLIDQIKAYLYHTKQWLPEQEHSFTPALSNRLDRNTGGLVLTAKTAPAQKMLNERIRRHEVSKYYLLAVHGTPTPPAGRIEGFLQKDSSRNKVTAVSAKTQEAKSAITEYRTLETRGELSLVECRLITGRSHQIRVQMADLGTPLLGDPKYGKEKGSGKHSQQALWAYRLRFDFSGDAGVLNHLQGKEFFAPDAPFVKQHFGEGAL